MAFRAASLAVASLWLDPDPLQRGRGVAYGRLTREDLTGDGFTDENQIGLVGDGHDPSPDTARSCAATSRPSWNPPRLSYNAGKRRLPRLCPSGLCEWLLKR